VHPLPVRDDGIEMAAHDIPLDLIVTPDEVIRVRRRLSRPAGIFWELLPSAMIETISILSQRQGGRVAEKP